MLPQILHQLDYSERLLVYFSGSITTTQSTKTYTAASIGVGLVAGDTIVVAGMAQSASNGTKTIATVTAGNGSFTVVEAIGTNETASGTFNQEYIGGWQEINKWVRLNIIANYSGNAVGYIDFSGTTGVPGTTKNVDYASTAAITGGTAYALAAENVARYARMRILNNGATQTIARAYFYGKTST